MAKRGILKDSNGNQFFPIDGKIEKYPLSTVFSKDIYKSLLAYRPLGNLQKGYIVLCEDDCYAQIMDFTIPLVIEHEVPVTFGAMNNSPIWEVSGGTEAMLNMVNKYGCELSQHGHFNWAGSNGEEIKTEEELMAYFDYDKDFFVNLGFSAPQSAIAPSHLTNNLVRAVTGARFGICRSGSSYCGTVYYGSGKDSQNVTRTFYESGPRSNIFSLPSVNITDFNGEENIIKGIVDYADTNHTVAIVYWHDQSIGDGVAWKSTMDTLINYAKSKNISFVRLKDLKTIK